MKRDILTLTSAVITALSLITATTVYAQVQQLPQQAAPQALQKVPGLPAITSQLNPSNLVPPAPAPPSTPPPGAPPATAAQAANANKVPDNQFQICTALDKGVPPPIATFSANSKQIPSVGGLGKTVPLCAIFPQFTEQQTAVRAQQALNTLNQIQKQMIAEHDTTSANFVKHLQQLQAQGLINCPTVQQQPSAPSSSSSTFPQHCSLAPPAVH